MMISKIRQPKLLTLGLAALLAGCTHGRFDRFMDHPILSWLPLDRWGVVNSSSQLQESLRRRYPDKQCLDLAKERGEFLDRSEYGNADLRKIFDLTYRECLRTKK